MAINGLPKDVISDEHIYATVILSYKNKDGYISNVSHIKDCDMSDPAVDAIVTVGKLTGAIEIKLLIRNRLRLIDPKTYTIHRVDEETMINTYELLKQNGVI